MQSMKNVNIFKHILGFLYLLGIFWGPGRSTGPNILQFLIKVFVGAHEPHGPQSLILLIVFFIFVQVNVKMYKWIFIGLIWLFLCVFLKKTKNIIMTSIKSGVSGKINKNRWFAHFWLFFDSPTGCLTIYKCSLFVCLVFVLFY